MIFDEVVITWKDVEYTIAPDKIMGAIARVEEVITLKELGVYAQKGDAPLARLAMAYASLLSYAGAKVTDAEIYHSMFDRNSNTNIIGCINVLLTMMIPPQKDEPPKKVVARKQSKGATSS
jgi:hypothetical protein